MGRTLFVIIFARYTTSKMKVSPVIPVLAAALAFSVSCIREEEPEKSPQAAIGAFTLGYYDVCINEIDYLGRDTVIKVREHGGMYPMTIDQLAGRIYNTDSLAFRSDLTAVTCNIMAKGTVVYEYLDNPGTGYLYSSNEPIDFSRPLSFTVVSSDGSYIRTYDFKLNVHQVFPDSLRWRKSEVPALSSPQLSILGDTLYLLGLDGSNCLSVASCPLSAGNWTGAVPATGLTGQPKSMMTAGGRLYVNCGQTLYSSTDGLAWTAIRDGVKALYAPTGEITDTTASIWMLDTAGKLCHSTDMQTWTESQNLPALFPDTSATAVYSTLKTNPGIRRALVAGPSQKDGHLQLWNRLSTDTVWTEIAVPANGTSNLPVMDNVRILEYDNRLFALGSGLNGFYQSNDNGITWFFCRRISWNWSTYNRFMQLPDELAGYAGEFACVTDGNGGIRLVTSDGRYWYGSILRLVRAEQ